MKLLAIAAFLALGAVAAHGQEQGTIETEALPPIQFDRGELRPLDETPSQSRLDPDVASAPGAVLRGLDKVSGDVSDIELAVGESFRLGRLDISLTDCRFPVDNQAGDAYARLIVRAQGLEAPAFDGWMIASSPALSALDHPRYDVWVIRCTTS